MNRSLVKVALATGSFLLATMPAGAGQDLSMTVSPHVAFAPSDLLIQVRVPNDPRNRGIEIAADSEDFYGSSWVQLNGDRAPRVSVARFRSVPGGDYVVTATLVRSDGGSGPSVREKVLIKSTVLR